MPQPLVFKAAEGPGPVLGPGVFSDANPFEGIRLALTVEGPYEKALGAAVERHVEDVRRSCVVVCEQRFRSGEPLLAAAQFDRFPNSPSILVVGARGKLIGHSVLDRRSGDIHLEGFGEANLGGECSSVGSYALLRDKLAEVLWSSLPIQRGGIVHDFGTGPDWARVRALKEACSRVAATLVCHEVVPSYCREAVEEVQNVAYMPTIPGVAFEFPGSEVLGERPLLITAQNLLSALTPNTLANFAAMIKASGCSDVVFDQINSPSDVSGYYRAGYAPGDDTFRDLLSGIQDQLLERVSPEMAFVVMQQLSQTYEVVSFDLVLRWMAKELIDSGFSLKGPQIISTNGALCEPVSGSPFPGILTPQAEQLFRARRLLHVTSGWVQEFSASSPHGTEPSVALKALRISFSRGAAAGTGRPLDETIFTPKPYLMLDRASLDVGWQALYSNTEAPGINISNTDLIRGRIAGAKIALDIIFDRTTRTPHPFAELVNDNGVERLYRSAYDLNWDF